MMALECGGDILLIDAGILFPGEEHHGIDAIVPDLSYLQGKQDRIRGLVLTHGHLDHIGGVPHLLQEMDLPVYGTDFALGLVRKQASEFTFSNPPDLRTIRPNEEIRLGCFSVEGIHVTHSIPQCLALGISTPAGCIVHTGDFKIDQTPVNSRPFDFETLAAYGKRGVVLLLADSTNADVPGLSASERSVGAAIEQAFAEAGESLYFTCFSSAIHRIQQVFDHAVRHRRKVALVGRSLTTSCNIATKLQLLRVPPGTLVDDRALETYPRHQRVAIIAGSQGEHRASLTRAAKGQLRSLTIEEGDTVAYSSKFIPGNERAIFRVIDNLHRSGAKVLYGSRCPGLHASGHPCREELKIMLNLLRPQYFVPIHGEYRQLAQHRQLAVDVLGKRLADSFVIENGTVLQVDEYGARVLEDRVPVGRRLIDIGTKSRIDRDGTMRERRHLSEFGVLVPVVTIDEKTGKAVDVEILDRGFAVTPGALRVLEGAEDVIRRSVQGSSPRVRRDVALMEDRIQKDLRRLISRRTSRLSRPVVMPILLDA